MKPTLVVLAAGIGSRYGGLKQTDAVGPAGEWILDYSVYDAARSGFGRVLFVIARDTEAAFRALIGDRLARRMDIGWVYQEMACALDGFPVPPQRAKPWGTAHAVLVCAEAADGPFVVANADDFYGRETFETMARCLREKAGGPARYCMAGYRLRNVLSEHGAVARGICTVSRENTLLKIVERTGIQCRDGVIRCAQATYTGDETVSMNLWGLQPSIFTHLRRKFAAFLRERGADPGAEFFIPTVIDELIAEHEATVDVVSTPCSWFGVTYRQDKPVVARHLRELIAAGVYPERLWG